jgi:anti-sigma regulatory factor (Ser/Thr protein kinase)
MTNHAPTDPQPPSPAAAGAVQEAIQPGDTMAAVLEQPFTCDSLYQLRAAVAAHAAQAGVPSPRDHDVVLAVHELAANVIRYGSGHGRVRIWANEDGLHCQVTDAGPPSPASMTTDPGPDPASTAPVSWPIQPGHGLWVVCRLADQASFDAGPPSTAAFSFALGPAEVVSSVASEPNR